jgi:TonB family protein
VKKEFKQKDFLPKPEYPGGPKALAAFIQTNLKYPQAAFDKKIEGIIVLKAEINFRGEVIDTKVISGLGHGCDEEAERVVRLLKFHVDKIRNLKITYFKTFNIQFKLPVQKAQTINYVVVPETKTDPTKKPSVTYNITLKYN